MSLKIVLVDDEPTQHRLLSQMIHNHPLVMELISFYSAEEVLFELETLQEVSCFFLDVEMKEMNGLDLARNLRKRNVEIPIVFMTAYAEFALESYEVLAFDYLLKPLDTQKVFALLERLSTKKPKSEATIFFNSDRVQRYFQKDLYGLEAQGHYTRIILKDHEIQVRESISNIMARLNNDFIFTHRSYAINLHYVQQIKPDIILLDNESIIPISRRLVKEVTKAFVEFHKQKDFSL